MYKYTNTNTLRDIHEHISTHKNEGTCINTHTKETFDIVKKKSHLRCLPYHETGELQTSFLKCIRKPRNVWKKLL